MIRGLVLLAAGLTLAIEVLGSRVRRGRLSQDRLALALTRVFFLKGARDLVLAVTFAFLALETTGWLSYAMWLVTVAALMRGIRQTWVPSFRSR